jgi:hypothetical protein
MRIRPIIAYLLGGAAALLLARLLLQIFAARPDNLFVQALLWATWPLVAPLKFLDAGQPRFGAVLELSTLALFVILAIIGIGLRVVRQRSEQ